MAQLVNVLFCWLFITQNEFIFEVVYFSIKYSKSKYNYLSNGIFNNYTNSFKYKNLQITKLVSKYVTKRDMSGTNINRTHISEPWRVTCKSYIYQVLFLISKKMSEFSNNLTIVMMYGKKLLPTKNLIFFSVYQWPTWIINL